MVWRIIQRFLLNDKLIDKLADSYPIRRAAQWVVYFVNKNRLKGIDSDDLFNRRNQWAFQRLSGFLQEKLKLVAENLKKKANK